MPLITRPPARIPAACGRPRVSGRPRFARDGLDGVHAAGAPRHVFRSGLFERTLVRCFRLRFSDQQGDLAFDGLPRGEDVPDTSGGAAQKLFVQLGQFARDDDGARPEQTVDVGQRGQQAVGRFVKDERGRTRRAAALEDARALARLGRQETAEPERIGRQPGGRDGSDQCGGPGMG